MPNIDFTIEEVKKSVLTAIEKNQRFLFNELELQMLVACRLEQDFKADDGYIVHLEYRLPKGWNDDFDKAYAPWGETPYFDIVLEYVKNNKSQYIGIELKYKLKEVKLKEGDTEFKRFDKPGQKGIKLVSNQAAENEGRYDFWKDVKRLELLAEHFKDSVIGGIAIFLTNQGNYTNQQPGNKYSPFNLSEKQKDTLLYWDHQTQPTWCNKWQKDPCTYCKNPCGEAQKTEPAKRKDKDSVKWGSELCHYKRPNFSFKNTYKPLWLIGSDGWLGPLGQRFYCCYVTIPKCK